MSRTWFAFAALMCSLAVQGCGHTQVDHRVAALEHKVKELERQLKVVESELARTPRLGPQTVR
jgi:hypothetical protein